MRKNFYGRSRTEGYAQDSSAGWLAYGEASYGYGSFKEAVAAFERGMALGSVQCVFTMPSSYPQPLRALARQSEADAVAPTLSTSTPSSTVASPPEPFALYLALVPRVEEPDLERRSRMGRGYLREVGERGRVVQFVVHAHPDGPVHATTRRAVRSDLDTEHVLGVRVDVAGR